MFEWLQTWPDWLQNFWFLYITFHDLIQWGIMLIIGYTAWGQRRQKKELQELALVLQKELNHVHGELHIHMHEDASLHADLGQRGMRKGESSE